MSPRPKTAQGARRTRLPEALYHEEEAALVRSVADGSVSNFIREAVLKAARKADIDRNRKSRK